MSKDLSFSYFCNTTAYNLALVGTDVATFGAPVGTDVATGTVAAGVLSPAAAAAPGNPAVATANDRSATAKRDQLAIYFELRRIRKQAPPTGEHPPVTGPHR